MAHIDYFTFMPPFKSGDVEGDRAQTMLKSICDYFEINGIKHDSEIRHIYKVPDNFPPRFCPRTMNPGIPFETIYLSMQDYRFLGQFVYQLSHEMTHCMIYCNNKNENQKASWIEESISEMMSFVLLDYINTTWCDIALTINMDDVNKQFWKKEWSNYLNNAFIKTSPPNYRLSHATLDELEKINATSQETREDRWGEVQEMIKRYDASCLDGLIKYKDYVLPGTIYLDTKRYRVAFPSNRVIEYLCDLQDTIFSR